MVQISAIMSSIASILAHRWCGWGSGAEGDASFLEHEGEALRQAMSHWQPWIWIDTFERGPKPPISSESGLLWNTQ
jgi:hypothetical protein